MTLHISSVFTYDEDAGNYIQAVEAADGQALEGATRQAINNFVLGCKADGIWDAIKASCILAGARTLNGALVPLAGTAPTNFNFVAGNYDRKTGLVGNGSTKYLDSNRAEDADPATSKHLYSYVTIPPNSFGNSMIGGDYTDASYSNISYAVGSQALAGSINNPIANQKTVSRLGQLIGGAGATRNSSSSLSILFRGSIEQFVSNGGTPTSTKLFVFRRNSSTFEQYFQGALAFYSIGEALDLALLDARVTDLINAFGAAIP